MVSAVAGGGCEDGFLGVCFFWLILWYLHRDRVRREAERHGEWWRLEFRGRQEREPGAF